MNEMFCPGCGEKVCDFVTYCPDCGFSIRDYEEKQRKKLTEEYFSDMLPINEPSEAEQINNGTEKQGKEKKAKSKKRLIAVMVSCVVAAVILTVSLTLPMQKTDQSGVAAPIVVDRNYVMDDLFTTQIRSEVTEPFVAVYRGYKGDNCCVYVEGGNGEYTGDNLTEAIGYLPVEPSVHMRRINTTYQKYVDSHDETLCLIDFDITFDQPVSGLFLYEISYGFQRKELSGINNDDVKFNGSVSVKEGHCRIVEPVKGIPSGFTIQSKLTPVCFVKAEQPEYPENRRLWGGQVKFLEFSDYCLCVCNQKYIIRDHELESRNTMILCRYTIESGGDEIERGKSVYYHYLGNEENNTEINHTQYLYGTYCSKPTYLLDIIGLIQITPFERK